MKIQAEDYVTKQVRSFDASGLDEQTIINYFNNRNMSNEEIRRVIDRLEGRDITAERKAGLASILELKVMANNYIIPVGKKILDIAIKFYTEFPNTSFMLVIGFIASYLIYSIPVLGFLLGPIIAPIAILALGTIGLREDIFERNLKRSIRYSVAETEKLRNEIKDYQKLKDEIKEFGTLKSNTES